MGTRSVVRIGKTAAKTMYITIPCIAATIVEGQLYKEALCSRYCRTSTCRINKAS